MTAPRPADPVAPPPKPWRRRLKKALRGTWLGRVLHACGYGAFRLALAALERVPTGWEPAASAALGFAFRWLHRRGWRTARRNLAAAYPGRADELARAHFRHLAAAAIDTARADRALRAHGVSALERSVEWEDPRELEALAQARDRGRGAILVVPHLGNWELLGLELGRRGFPAHTVARTIENRWVDAWVVRFRSRTGLRLLDKKGAVRDAVRALRDGRLLLVLPDQYGGSTGVPARFFGTSTSVPALVGALARRLDVPLFLASAIRVAGGRYRARCEPVALPAGGDAPAATQEVFAAIEGRVRQAPEQWLWVHDFWRDRLPKPRVRERSLYRRVKRVLKNAGLWSRVQAVQYVVFRAAVAALAAVPAKALPRVAALLAAVAPVLLRRERRTFARNMDRVFGPAFPPAGRRRAFRAVLESFVAMAYDGFVFARRVRPGTFFRHFEVVGLDRIDEARRAGKGVIFVLAHLGNWELASLHMAALGYPMVGIFAERTNPRIDDWLTRLRTSTGAEFLHREGAYKRAIRALQANRCLSLVADLDAGPEGVFVDFFGVPASTLPTAATLARRTGARLIPFSSERVGPLSYRNTFHPPIPVAPDATDAQVMSEVTRVLERAIAARPEQWAWMANRWKTRPGTPPA